MHPHHNSPISRPSVNIIMFPLKDLLSSILKSQINANKKISQLTLATFEVVDIVVD